MSFLKKLHDAFLGEKLTPRMRPEDVTPIAKALALEKNVQWREPVGVGFNDRTAQWTVTTNAQSRGSNFRVVIDDRTGKVERYAFHPR